MGWPYEFVDLSPEERGARRLVLDRYARYTEIVVLLPAAVAVVVRLVRWLVIWLRHSFGGSGGRDGSGTYDRIPNSPALKSMRRTTRSIWATRLRRVQWWVSEDVILFGTTCGQRDQWLASVVWVAVLFGLCVLETGKDYLHITKRFGAVGAAQFPVQYILGLKWANPFGLVFGCSHELLNRWHRVLGVFVYTLLVLHTAFYLNFFAQAGGFWGRIARPIVIVGLFAFSCMTLMCFTSLVTFVRLWSYRLFFITHVVVSVALPPLIMYHAHHANVYMASALLLLLADVTLRKINTVSTEAVLEAIPGTDLLRVSAPLPPSKVSLFGDHPASHVYVNLPPASRPSRNLLAPSSLMFEFLFNPFTVASVNEDTSDLTLVVRAHKGPMTTTLARHAIHTDSAKENGDDDDSEDDPGEDAPAIPLQSRTDVSTTPPPASPSGLLHVDLEGPYGASAHFPDLSPYNFDHVLLVAGGVGATFIVPLYCATRNSPGMKVDFVWAVRDAADASWASISGQEGSASLLADPNVHLFLTSENDGNSNSNSDHSQNENRDGNQNADGQSVELAGMANQSRSRFAPGGMHQRPDLRHIVDEVFRQGVEDRVAVLVCGPESMARDLRASVSTWVKKGRTVWWHNEAFGW